MIYVLYLKSSRTYYSATSAARSEFRDETSARLAATMLNSFRSERLEGHYVVRRVRRAVVV